MSTDEKSTNSIELMSDTAEQPREGCLFGVEHSLQGVLRPAEWCIGLRAGRRQRRQWTIQNTGIEDFCQSFDLILADVNTNQNELKRLSARPIDTKRVAASRKTKTNISSGAITQGHFSVDIITAVGWLDVLDVDIHTPPPAGDSAAVGSASIVVTLTLASTGFLPLKVPGASLFNVLFCWVPFLSVEQSQRLLFFKEKVNAWHVIEHEEVLCHY